MIFCVFRKEGRKNKKLREVKAKHDHNAFRWREKRNHWRVDESLVLGPISAKFSFIYISLNYFCDIFRQFFSQQYAYKSQGVEVELHLVYKPLIRSI